MIEVKADLWTYPADIRVITTNGCVKKNGEAVMGRGCARQAANRYPGIAVQLGRLLKDHGNVVHFLSLSVPGQYLVTFPVKHNWWEDADLDLIESSAYTLSYLCNPIIKVAMPRPGCGNGRLLWKEVRPVLEPILDDRFHILSTP